MRFPRPQYPGQQAEHTFEHVQVHHDVRAASQPRTNLLQNSYLQEAMPIEAITTGATTTAAPSRHGPLFGQSGSLADRDQASVTAFAVKRAKNTTRATPVKQILPQNINSSPALYTVTKRRLDRPLRTAENFNPQSEVADSGGDALGESQEQAAGNQLQKNGMRMIRISHHLKFNHGAMAKNAKKAGSRQVVNGKAIDSRLSRATSLERGRGSIAAQTGMGVLMNSSKFVNETYLRSRNAVSPHQGRALGPSLTQPGRKSTTTARERPVVLHGSVKAAHQLAGIYGADGPAAQRRRAQRPVIQGSAESFFDPLGHPRQDYGDALDYVSPQDPHGSGAPLSGATATQGYYNQQPWDGQQQERPRMRDQATRGVDTKARPSIPNISRQNLSRDPAFKNMQLVKKALNEQDKQSQEDYKKKKKAGKIMDQIAAISSTQNVIIQQDLTGDDAVHRVVSRETRTYIDVQDFPEPDGDEVVIMGEPQRGYPSGRARRGTAMEQLTAQSKFRGDRARQLASPVQNPGHSQVASTQTGYGPAQSEARDQEPYNYQYEFAQLTCTNKNQVPVSMRSDTQSASLLAASHAAQSAQGRNPILRSERQRAPLSHGRYDGKSILHLNKEGGKLQKQPRRNLKIASLLSLERHQDTDPAGSDYHPHQQTQDATAKAAPLRGALVLGGAHLDYGGRAQGPLTAKNITHSGASVGARVFPGFPASESAVGGVIDLQKGVSSATNLMKPSHKIAVAGPKLAATSQQQFYSHAIDDKP